MFTKRLPEEFWLNWMAVAWAGLLSRRTSATSKPANGPRTIRRSPSATPLSFERLEDRTLLSSFNVAVSPQDVLAAAPGDWFEQSSAISASNRVDTYSFTLSQTTGVFIDVDARDIGLSSLDSVVILQRPNGVQVASNDDGFDFEVFNPADGRSRDSSLYADLAAGNYQIRVEGFSGVSTGAYLLRLLFDTTYAAAVPVFNSLPGAAASVYIDLDGHAASDAWGNYSASRFNFGGGPNATFSPGERLAIRNLWSVTAEDYSPFDINVTTVNPGGFVDRSAQRMVVTQSDGSIVDHGGSLGVAFVDSFASGGPTDQVAWVFAGEFDDFGAGPSAGFSGRIVAAAGEMGGTTSHEFGHALGLDHWAQSPGDANGATVFPDGIMSTPDGGLNRELWKVGSRTEDGHSQNDIAVIANATNGFGFRTDDHGDTPAAATVLPGAAPVKETHGVVSEFSDLDVFRFQASGLSTISVDVDEFVNNLDVQIRLLNSSGGLIASSDPTDSFDAAVSTNLSNGTYFLEVRSDGEAGELGQYRVRVLTFGAANSPPVARDDNLATSEDASVAADLFADNGQGADSDTETPLNISLVEINGAAVSNGQVVTLASGALLTVQSNGNVVYNPNGQFDSLPAGGLANDTFSYTIVDGDGRTASASVTVAVSGLNDAPVATNNAFATIKGNSASGNLITDDDGFGADRDVDGSTLQITHINGLPVVNGQMIVLASGARLTIFSDGRYLYNTGVAFNHLTPGQSAADGFNYTLADSQAVSDTAQVGVTIFGGEFNIAGNSAVLVGSDGPDSIIYRVVNRLLNINGRTHVLPSHIDFVRVEGSGGDDLLNLIATSGDETALTRPGQVFLEHDSSHAGFDFAAGDLETVIVDGNGGNDAVTIRDSMGEVNERLFARPAINNALLFASDASYFTSVFGFQVTALFSDGDDLVRFFDSAANEVVIARPGNASLSSGGLVTNVQNFDSFLARSLGGTDVANLFGTTAVDFLTGRNGFAVLSAGGVNLQFDSFETVNANGLGGDDLVRFLGGPQDDLLVAGPDVASFTTGVSVLNATSFERLIAEARTGANDRAILTGTAGADAFAGSPSFGELTGLGFFHRTFNFDRITIRGLAGVNTLTDNGINYVLIQQGTWV